MRGAAFAIAVVLGGWSFATASAGKRPDPPRARRVTAPPGALGEQGSGASIPIAFAISDAASRPADVEVQYAVDADGNGRFSRDEYLPAAEDTADPRGTRGSGGPGRFATSSGRGTENVFVWRSRAGLVDRRIAVAARRSERSGVDAGVRIRVRAIGDDGRAGPWSVSRPFPVDDRRAPDVRTAGAYYGRTEWDSAEQRTRQVVEVEWRAVDPDSEDADGDGALDPGEDTNGNGVLDAPAVQADFWYHKASIQDQTAFLLDPSFDYTALTWTRCETTTDSSGFLPQSAHDDEGGAAPTDGVPAHVFEWDATGVASSSRAVATLDPWQPTPEWVFLRIEPRGRDGLPGPTRYLLTPIRSRAQ